MEVKKINIEQFEDYVYNAFIDDDELLEFYDRSVNAKTTTEAIENICDKIEQSYPDAKIFGVEIEKEKAGFFVVRESLLISFGIKNKFRNRDNLSLFWSEIKSKLGSKFQALLYSHNSRAINFLVKGEMRIVLDHITVLSYGS